MMETRFCVPFMDDRGLLTFVIILLILLTLDPLSLFLLTVLAILLIIPLVEAKENGVEVIVHEIRLKIIMEH